MSRKSVVIVGGGTATNEFARLLKKAGVATTHVIPTFDNGGSTGKLRRVYGSPAVGDLRNRLTHLADPRAPLLPLMNWRFPEEKPLATLRTDFESLCSGKHRTYRQVPAADIDLCTTAFCRLRSADPTGRLPLHGLSIGNAILLGLALGAAPIDLIGAIDRLRRSLSIDDVILPVTLDSRHLGAETGMGRWLTGQHAITTERESSQDPIASIFFLKDDKSNAFREPPKICVAVSTALSEAIGVVVSFGSFYTSIVATLRVPGVLEGIRRVPGPRWFLVNPWADSETRDLTAARMVDIIDAGVDAPQPTFTHMLVFEDGIAPIPSGELRRRVDAGTTVRRVSGVVDPESVNVAAVEAVLSSFGKAAHHLRPKARVRRAALFDLDLTLFDYDEVRRKATEQALYGMVEHPGPMAVLLLRLLRPPVTDVLHAAGFADLRRSWNSPDLFALAEAVDRDHALLDRLRSVLPTVGEPNESLDDWLLIQAFVRDSSSNPILKELRPILEQRTNRHAEARGVFDRAVVEFATLAPGARALLEALRPHDCELHVVTEGLSDIQVGKAEALNLSTLVDSVVVSDTTADAAVAIASIRRLASRGSGPLPALAKCHNALSQFSRKTPSFYWCLLNSLATGLPAELPQRMRNPQILSLSEWGEQALSATMLGDNYQRDIEPLLRTAPTGVRAYRVLSGRYRSEDPLHLLQEAHRPLPSGVFANLDDAAVAVVGSVASSSLLVGRPQPPVLPVAEMRETSRLLQYEDPDAAAVIGRLLSERAP